MAVPALAQNKPVTAGTARYGIPTGTGRKYENFLSGVLKTVDENGMVLAKTKYGVDQTFVFSRKTKFLRDEKPSTWKELKVGEVIWVNARQDKKTGDLIAREVVTGIIVCANGLRRQVKDRSHADRFPLFENFDSDL